MSAELRLEGLRRRLGREEVLAGLDLTVPAGNCVALLGPSGSGKSTALRLAAGLDTPDRGRVLVGGRDLAGVPTERRGTAMVFQRPRLFPHLTVLANVAFPLEVAGERRREARREAGRFLALVGADALASRRPATLSGGQEQRVALARALAARPGVLLLDEPFSALDPVVRGEMHQLLGELRAAVEPTVLVVTHDRAEAAAVADTVAVLLGGRVVQHAPVGELYRRPASLAVARFLGGLNEVAGDVRNGVHVSPAGALELPPGAPAADGPAVLAVRQEAVRVTTADDPAADLVGTVARALPRGPRTLVEVATPAGSVSAEVPPGTPAVPGAPAGLVLPLEQRWALPVDGSRHTAGAPVS